MNKAILVGRLGQDPKHENNVCKFSIATNDGTKEKQKTNWHNVVAFGKTGETLANYLKKGDQIAIEGRIDYHKHEDKVYTSVIVDRFTFVGGGSQQANDDLDF